MEELKPCPFCGGENLKIEDGYADCGCWVECCTCGANNPFRHGTHSEAFAAWNTRAKDKESEILLSALEQIGKGDVPVNGVSGLKFIANNALDEIKALKASK